MDYTALKAELDAGHPSTGAYNADSSVALSQINAINRASIRENMSGRELLDQTDATEYDALTDALKSQWLAFTGHDSIDTSVGGMGQTIGVGIFGGGSTTAANISSARSITISRATELGFGTLKPGDIEYARTLP